jgi:hypothetical protein
MKREKPLRAEWSKELSAAEVRASGFFLGPSPCPSQAQVRVNRERA